MHFWRHVLAFVAILTFASNADILRHEAKLTVGGNANFGNIVNIILDAMLTFRGNADFKGNIIRALLV